MGLIGKVNSKVAKLAEEKGVAFTGAYSLSNVLGANLPALQCDFKVYVNTALEPDLMLPSDVIDEPYYCFWALDVSIPKTGFTFKPAPIGIGAIEGEIEAGTLITVVYWDTKQFTFSRIIENLYRNQLTEYGTLRQDYKQSELWIQIDYFMLKLTEGAFSRPSPLTVTAETAGLLQCSFQFAYEDYAVLYANIASTGLGTYAPAFQDKGVTASVQEPYQSKYTVLDKI